MKTLDNQQRRVIADFCSNFSVAWFVAGMIAPFVSGTPFKLDITLILSVFWGGFFLGLAVSLGKEGRKKRR